jgi:hypothetical protein
LERDQTERDKSERDKSHISADPDFAQTELAKNHVLQIWNPRNQNLECNQTTTRLRRKAGRQLRERERER